MVLDDWQRIEKIVRWTGLSVNSFAHAIGLARGENLYQIKRGNNGISKELAELIATKYPEISRAWIITGEGNMFLGDSGERVAIPCYDTDVVALTAMESLPQPSHVISLPRLKGVSFAGLLLNKSMEPEIPNGATVIASEVDPTQMIPGYAYIVVTDKFSVLRRIKKEPDNDKLRLVAANPEYDDMVVDICQLQKLFMVKGHIYYNQ